MKPKYREYNPDDPQDVADLVYYVLKTMKARGKCPSNYDVEDLLGMAYIAAQDLTKSYNPKKGVTFTFFMFKFLPSRFFDYFLSHEAGKKKNTKRNDEGKVSRPKGEPRYVDKYMTNSDDLVAFIAQSADYSQFNIKEDPFRKIVFEDLNQKQKDVIYLLAWGHTQRNIGKMLEVTESRVCQIRKEAQSKCRLEHISYTLKENEYSIS